MYFTAIECDLTCDLFTVGPTHVHSLVFISLYFTAIECDLTCDLFTVGPTHVHSLVFISYVFHSYWMWLKHVTCLLWALYMFILLSLCRLISISLFPYASVRLNNRAWVPHFLLPYWIELTFLALMRSTLFWLGCDVEPNTIIISKFDYIHGSWIILFSRFMTWKQSYINCCFSLYHFILAPVNITGSAQLQSMC